MSYAYRDVELLRVQLKDLDNGETLFIKDRREALLLAAFAETRGDDKPYHVQKDEVFGSVVQGNSTRQAELLDLLFDQGANLELVREYSERRIAQVNKKW